jgi:uncharacterized cupredoxin-like copper-binding protein
MSIRRLTVALAVVAAVVGIGASSVFGAQGQTNRTVIKVTASEFKFVLSAKTAKAGPVTFVVTNRGALQHDFKIGTKKTPLLSKGKSSTITVTIKKGKNAYMCTVSGHAAAGMKGTFTGR